MTAGNRPAPSGRLGFSRTTRMCSTIRKARRICGQPCRDLRHLQGQAWMYGTKPQRIATQAVTAGKDRQHGTVAQWSERRTHRSAWPQVRILPVPPALFVSQRFNLLKSRQGVMTQRARTARPVQPTGRPFTEPRARNPCACEGRTLGASPRQKQCAAEYPRAISYRLNNRRHPGKTGRTPGATSRQRKRIATAV